MSYIYRATDEYKDFAEIMKKETDIKIVSFLKWFFHKFNVDSKFQQQMINDYNSRLLQR